MCGDRDWVAIYHTLYSVLQEPRTSLKIKIPKRMAMIPGRILSSNLRCLLDMTCIWRQAVTNCVAILQDRILVFGLPTQIIFLIHRLDEFCNLSPADMKCKSKTTDVPSHKMFLTLLKISLAKVRFWCLYNLLVLVICYPIKNMKFKLVSVFMWSFSLQLIKFLLLK